MKGLLSSLGIFGAVMAGVVLGLEFLSYALLSQVEMPPMDGITSITSIGFAIWYGWYVTTRAIPKIVEQHSQQLERVEAAHGKQMDSISETFRQEMAATRDKFSCQNRNE